MQFLERAQFVDNLNSIFSELKLRIQSVLPNSEVDHIGSSAIEGAISKGDLDILVRVHKDSMDRSVESIRGIGFEPKIGTLRTNALCMLVTNDYSKDVAIQLIARNSEFEDFLRFRDMLNASPELVLEYNQLKLNCTGFTPEAYRAQKSKFIERVLGK